MSRSALFLLLASLATGQQDAGTIPNFRDLTIKTRVTRGLTPPQVTILRLKGARTRAETRPDSPQVQGSFFSRITQCDLRAHITLFERQKNYRRDDFFRLPQERRANGLGHVTGIAGVISVPRREIGPADGPLVRVKYESVDTGERREIGGYTADRIKTTITVDPSKGASAKKSKTKIDGWYLDIPGWHCDQPPMDPRLQFTGGWHLQMRPGGRDHFVFKYEGTAPGGYTVEETSTEKSAGNTVVNKTELIEVSEAPLDASLFEVPADFSPAPSPTFQPIAPQSAPPAPPPPPPPSR